MFWDVFLLFAEFLETDFALAVLAVLFFGLIVLKRRVSLLVALLLLLVLLPSLKLAYADARPCAVVPGIIECPFDYGLPSGHAAAFSLFAIAAVGSWWFFPFALLAIAASYSRVFLGVHSVQQVGAGIALVFVLYVIGLALRHRFHKPVRFGGAWKTARLKTRQEASRKAVHVVLGTVMVLFGVLFGRDALIALLSVALLGLLAVATLLMKGWRLPLLSRVFDEFERDVDLPGKGAMYFVVGSLLVASFSQRFEYALAVIAVLALGDGLATIIGKFFGRARVAWNKAKSWEGTAAFAVVGALAGYVFIGLASVPLALILAFAETLPLDVDDNLLIPFVALLLEFMVRVF